MVPITKSKMKLTASLMVVIFLSAQTTGWSEILPEETKGDSASVQIRSLPVSSAPQGFVGPLPRAEVPSTSTGFLSDTAPIDAVISTQHVVAAVSAARSAKKI